ncbi:MAG: cupin [Planctomycetes bacterium RBG_16_64_10]|nr:MAG: cupin [Planctomycetes bacterium RBG_16_64_10]
MKVQHVSQIEPQPVSMEGARGCTVRWLIGQPDGAPNFAMRQFEVAPGGHTPRHRHPYEHEVFVLAGTGAVSDGATERSLSAGDVVYVGPDEVHQFRNSGATLLKFLCLVPLSSAGQPVTVMPECSGGACDRGPAAPRR